MWHLKSCSLWLQSRDMNTSFFHHQSKARVWKNKVVEIKTTKGKLISSFEEIKKVAFKHFGELYSETG
jgi:hypothetical protein